MAITKQAAKEAKNLLLDIAREVEEQNENRNNRNIAVSTGKDLLIVRNFSNELAKVFKKGYCTPCKYNGRPKSRLDRMLSVVLSDTHFGACLDAREVPAEYGRVQESRRLGRVASQVADYKHQYRAETKLLIHILGDIIDGLIHSPIDNDPLTVQFGAAVHYLVQFILFQASQFPQVEVWLVPGNHGRNIAVHAKRATDRKWDSIETMLYMAVEAAIKASGVNNVKINISRRPYYTVQLFDNVGFFTHGDTVLKPGTPGKNIDTKGLYQQICRWNSAKNIGGPFKLFACGHVHFGSVTNMPNGVVMLTNGCLVPTDSFGISIGQPNVACGQYMFESVEGHVVGDQRFISVDDADNEPCYNDIIKLYGGFDGL